MKTMICILKLLDGRPTQWLMAGDMAGARRRAEMLDEPALARLLAEMPYMPDAGEHRLASGHIMLVGDLVERSSNLMRKVFAS